MLGLAAIILKYFSFDAHGGGVIPHSLALALCARYSHGQRSVWADMLYLPVIVRDWHSLIVQFNKAALPCLFWVTWICYRNRCLADKSGDRVPGVKLVREDMTTELCHEYCNVQEAFYMATQSGNECFCSRAEDLDYSRHRPGICDQSCAGNESERCGSYYAFDLYEIVWPDASTDPEYVRMDQKAQRDFGMDCYADSAEGRVMSDQYIRYDMTSTMCRRHCKGKGALYYATQFGNECWCGLSDVFADYEKHGLGTCNMRCAGDQSEACGGRHSLSLYRFNDYSPEPAVSTSESCLGSSSETNPELISEPTSGLLLFDGINFTGDGTYYGDASTGNCTFRSQIPKRYDGMIPVALNNDQYKGSEMYGACIEGKRSGNGTGVDPITGSFKAYVMDKCPECTYGSLKFFESGDGRLDISWSFVPCPSGFNKPSSILEGSHEF